MLCRPFLSSPLASITLPPPPFVRLPWVGKLLTTKYHLVSHSVPVALSSHFLSSSVLLSERRTMCFSPYSLMRQTVYTYKLHMNVGDTAAGTARINLNLQGVTDWKCGRINTGSMLFQQRPSPPRRSGSTHPPHIGQASPIPPTKVRQHPSPPQRSGSTHPHHKGQAAPIPTELRQHPSPQRRLLEPPTILYPITTARKRLLLPGTYCCAALCPPWPHLWPPMTSPATRAATDDYLNNRFNRLNIFLVSMNLIKKRNICNCRIFIKELNIISKFTVQTEV